MTWMTKQDVAEYLRCTVRTVTRLKIRHSYVGRLPRYDKAVVDEYLARNAITPRDKATEKGRPRRRAAPLTGRNYSAELDEFRRGSRRR